MCKDKELAGVIGAARALLRAARRWGVLGVVLALAVLTVGRVSAQNLVPNPSFESYSAIPTGLAVSGEINLASFWSSPTDASPDYFHSLATSSSSVSVPANVFGSQLPVTGQAYAGFHARPDILYREYVETPLSSPLVAGQTYQVSFYVSLADKCQWAVDKIGAYLSVGSVGPVNTVYTLPFTPQINNPVNNYITNKLGWTLIAGQYVAAGGEDHITIGNFLDDPSTTPQTGQGGFYQFAYYYLDDVSVTPLCAPPPSGMVAWWPLDETSGTTVQDIVSSYDGTAMSDPVTPGPIGSFGTSGPVSSYFWPPPTFPVGQVGNSLFFYSARHVKVPHATALDPSTDGFTVDAWVIYAPSGNGAYLGIVQKGDSGSSDWWRLAIHDTAGVGELKFDVFAGIGGGAACALTPGLWAPGTWHHVAATLTRQVSDAVITLYVDGNQVTTSLVGIGFATSIASTDDLFIGRSDGAATGEFAVDEVEIFGRALSPQEVQGISDARLMGKCGCVKAPSDMGSWWPADGNANDIVGGNHGTLVGSAAFTPGMVGDAFNLTGGHVEVLAPVGLDFGTDDLSIDAWILIPPGSPSLTATYLPIVDKRDLPGGAFGAQSTGYTLFLYDGNLAFQLGDPGPGFYNYISPGPDLRVGGVWHHVAVTVDRDSPTGGNLYVDGAVVLNFNPTNRPGSLTNTQPLFIGRHAGAPSITFVGLIDEVEIFGRALSPQEVQGISDARLMGKCGCVKAPSDMGSWWPADGNANDIVGGNHGTLVGSAAFTPGMVGDAFNLTGGHVEVLAPVGLGFGTDDLSIDAWILIPTGSPSLTATYLPIVDKRDLPGGAFGAQSTGYFLFLYDGNLAFQLGDGTFFNYISDSGFWPDLRDGAYHHVAVTVDRDSPTGGNLYVDGAVVLNFNPTNRPGSLTNTQPLFIGRHAGAPSITFVGLIDEVEIFGRALSPQEVQGISDAGSSGKCKPDLGDAPDSSNHAGASMLAYAFPVVPAHFPTVYDPSLSGNAPLGPIHRNAKGLAWLGANVSFEGEADTGWDQELNTLGNNIQPSSGISNRDVDDGVASVPLPDCAMTSFKFSATNAGITPVGVYINVWFDWTRDGDWDDMPRCALDPVTTVLAPEWAVQNYLIALSPGFNAWPANPAMKTPAFLSMSPPLGQTVWMRITLTDVPIDANANGGPFPYPADLGKGGSGPAGGYCYGETEDYEIGPCGIVRGSIVAHDVYTSSVPYLQTTGDVRIEECVTRDTDAAGNVTDTYTYIVTNVSVYNNGCGLCAFQVPSPGLIGSMQNDLGWGNTMSSAWWLWRAALSPNCQSNPAYYGIQVGQSGRFWFSVPGPTSDTHVWAYGMLCDSQNPSPDLRLWTTGPATPCVQAPPGMISWWPGDGNTSDIMDSNPGTLLGSAGYAPGIVGQAFSFVAAGDGVSVSNAANLNFGGGDLSIDAWIVTSSTAGVLPIVDKRSGASGSQATGYTLFLFGGRLAFQLGDGTFFNYISASLLSDLRDGLPHHVAVTVDRTSNTGGNLYVDGVVVLNFNPTNRPGSLTNGEPLFIGRHAGTPSTSFIGLIDEVEIFGRELTAGEVLSIFTAGTAGKCK